ncbi:DUF769 domain-containing protein [Xylella fastidiosa]|uniref:DUF769 domain-containing protein n=1 Tax=Xylella fastidiosa TaxID=2371 RepID=UPI001CA3E23B|nr:DUF769 domain-containing protein [Xylella fastidiosa]
MIVNYVQQQGATAIGHWVATGQLTEGSPLHAALHALLACAGAAASQQHCSSGAQGAAASSVLTGLFSDTTPEDTAQDREAKRNLITSIVTGIASIGNTDAATATHAAIAAVDNNWLATQQKLQMENELKAARQKGFWAEEAVKAKWDAISAKQNILTASTLLLGLAESAKSDINGLVELIQHPIDTLHGLKALITDPAVRQQLGESLVQELNDRVDRIEANTIFGGDLDALEYGRGLGTVVWDVGALLVGVGGVAKGGELLAKAGIKVSEDVLERMAARNLEKLVVQYEKYVDNAVSLIDKRHPNNQFIISSRKFEPLPYDPNVKGGSNKAGNVKVFPSEVLTDKEIRQYAETWAQGAPFKETSKKGVYVAYANDGTIVHLRSVSSSSNATKARWTIDIENNPKLREVTKEKVEFKFR